MSELRNNSPSSLITPVVMFLSLFVVVEHIAVLQSSLGTVGLPVSPEIVSKVVKTLMWFTGAVLTSRLLVKLLINPFSRKRTGQDAPSILVNSVYASILIITGFMAVHFVFGRPIGALMATSGLVTLIIGLAIRDMIADFFSGLALNFERPYSIGDWIELEPGLVAKVTELNWRSTRLLTLSERTVIVPNNNFAARQFVNYSLPKRSYRESLDITLNFTSDPERIENILQSAIQATAGLISDASHNVRIMKFTERGVLYQIRFWIDDLSSRVGIRHKLAVNVLKYLSQAGISIPYSQQEILLTRDRRARQERRIDPKRLLSRIDWLEPLQDHELSQLAEVAEPADFAKGSPIFLEGEEGEILYFVVEGVAVVTTGTNGSSNVVGKITPGQAVGEMSVLTGTPRRANVFAETDVHALGIHRDDLEPLLRARPEIAVGLGNTMASRVKDMRAQQDNQNSGASDSDDTSLAKQLASRITSFFGIGQTH
ncbi:MAG: mechanosensitive ion channel [Gammaproteobacteria bacterium]|nr:mechanosensitive ion channel [Gammaproteobacteria bacterium]